MLQRWVDDRIEGGCNHSFIERIGFFSDEDVYNDTSATG